MVLQEARLKIQEYIIFDNDYLLIKLKQPLVKVKYNPGQFFVFKYILNEEISINRSYSVVSLPTEKTINFLIQLKPEGVASNFLKKNLKNFTYITISGPYGNFLSNYNSEEKSIFWASGIGITPFLPYLQDSSMKIDVKWSITHYYDYTLLKDIGLINRDISVYCKSLGNKLKMDNIEIKETTKHLGSHFLCGSEKYMKELTEKLSSLGITKQFKEAFSEVKTIPENYQRLKARIEMSEKSFTHTNNQTILETLIDNKSISDSRYSCMSGHCKLCKMRILEGKVLQINNEKGYDEIGENQEFLPCLSFAEREKLTFEL